MKKTVERLSDGKVNSGHFIALVANFLCLQKLNLLPIGHIR